MDHRKVCQLTSQDTSLHNICETNYLAEHSKHIHLNYLEEHSFGHEVEWTIAISLNCEIHLCAVQATPKCQWFIMETIRVDQTILEWLRMFLHHTRSSNQLCPSQEINLHVSSCLFLAHTSSTWVISKIESRFGLFVHYQMKNYLQPLPLQKRKIDDRSNQKEIPRGKLHCK